MKLEALISVWIKESRKDMSIYRLPSTKNPPELIDDYFTTGEQVYKFDSVSLFFSLSIVKFLIKHAS